MWPLGLRTRPVSGEAREPTDTVKGRVWELGCGQAPVWSHPTQGTRPPCRSAVRGWGHPAILVSAHGGEGEGLERDQESWALLPARAFLPRQSCGRVFLS